MKTRLQKHEKIYIYIHICTLMANLASPMAMHEMGHCNYCRCLYAVKYSIPTLASLPSTFIQDTYCCVPILRRVLVPKQHNRTNSGFRRSPYKTNEPF